MAEGRSGAAANLKRALREVRLAKAEQGDVVVEIRDAEQARLEILAEALDGAFEGMPDTHEQLLLGVLPGNPPRYWVDATSYVAMARDKRQYQFIKDTRLGRSILLESASVDAITDAVIRYVAERIVEREQAIEGDWLRAALRRPADASSVHRAGEGAAAVWGLCGFGLGMIAGMFLLLAYAWAVAG